MSDDVLTVSEAARLLGVTPHAVRALIQRGRLPARRFGRLWMLRLHDVRDYARERSARPKLIGRPAGARKADDDAPDRKAG